MKTLSTLQAAETISVSLMHRLYMSVLEENRGEKCKICATHALHMRANCAEKPPENTRKIARKLRGNVLWLRRKVFHGFV